MPIKLERTLVMPDRKTLVQDFDIHQSVFYVSQDSGKLCTISRVRDGKVLDAMRVPGSDVDGSHGDRLTLSLAASGAVLVRLKFAGRYVLLPYAAGRSWSRTEVLGRPVSYSDPAPKPLDDCQGQVTTGGWVIRTYGVPYKADGPTMAGDSGKRHPDNPGRLDIARDGRVVRKRDLSSLGRGVNGRPLDTRLELEGVCHEAGQIKIGCAVGPLSKLSQQIWTIPLAELVAGLGTYPLPDSRVVYVDRIKIGAKDSDSVYWVQRELGASTTGDYDDQTVEKAKAFQRKLGDTEIDGELGPRQLAALLAGSGITIQDQA